MYINGRIKHFQKSVPFILYKYIYLYMSSGYIKLINQNIAAREVLKCCVLCIFLRYKLVFYIDFKK